MVEDVAVAGGNVDATTRVELAAVQAEWKKLGETFCTIVGQ